ncbi:MAG: PD-(D/E)XK nuclease family protein [Armatimonadetes bacterium]|nr:PD-(D/E)XK nuclease family protein [Armatimonadota bacterium]MDE2205821.1 PD-(D/E)XK nuclease family protein [Armatimonadota bacterium]
MLAGEPSLFDPMEFVSGEPRTADDLGTVEWSYSRRSLLEKCPRQYYYAYYGANKRRAQNDPDKLLLHRLKGMSNRHMRVGDILHMVIANYFRARQRGDDWTLDRLTGWANDILVADITYSESDPRGENPHEGQFPPKLLHEFYYGWADVLDLYAEARERLSSALAMFYTAEAFGPLRMMGCLPDAEIERTVSIAGLPCRAEGKVDLYRVADGGIKIVDWKSGVPGSGGDDSLQLSAYGLWAHVEQGIPPQLVSVSMAFLGNGAVVSYGVSDSEMAATRARICQDAERMALAHEYVALSGSAAFTAHPQPRVCQMCPFLCACSDGKECVDA